MSMMLLKALMLLWVTSVPVSSDPACNGKGAGAPCRAQLSDGEREGVCLGLPGEAVLTCMPAPPPPPSGSGHS
jgi:hypothetical protein